MYDMAMASKYANPATTKAIGKIINQMDSEKKSITMAIPMKDTG